MRRILLLDDEPNVLLALQRTLRQFGGLRVEAFTDPEEALLRCGEIAFDVVVSDYRMPGMNGIDFLRMVKGIQPDAIRLVLSASTEFSTVMNAVNQAEVFRFISKPWHDDELKEVLSSALARRGVLSAQELEARRLEELEPGIMKVNWNADGAVELD